MTKQQPKCLSQRRLLITTSLGALFIIYLLFDIDFVYKLDIDNDDVEHQPKVIIEPPKELTKPIDIEQKYIEQKYIEEKSNLLSSSINESVRDQDGISNVTTSSHGKSKRTFNKKKLSEKRDPAEKAEIFEKYGFDMERWREWGLSKRHCPYFSNICVYKQHFYVDSEDDLFTLMADTYPRQLFGDRIKHSIPSFDIYKQVFDARIWNKSMNEYESSNCLYDEETDNHIILSTQFMSMMGEFYLKVLTALHWLFNEREMLDKYERDYKFYIMLPEFADIFLGHRLFMERFTKYELQQFVDLFEHYRCKCYRRLFFCGFQKLKDDDNGLYQLLPKQNLFGSRGKTLFDRIPYFQSMINEYQLFITKHHTDIKEKVIEWKQNKLDLSLRNQDASQWKFIGLYQRTKRRRWKNLRDALRVCNLKYNEYKIFCIEINLEGFWHSMDIILMHQSCNMLIGIHGATLTDAIWMEHKMGNYIVELLPYNGPDWTSSLNEPTLSGILFWNTTYNYVGLSLSEQSISSKLDPNLWYEHDFTVQVPRLLKVINFLLIDDDGMCNKFKRADQIQIPQDLKDEGFAIYNAYCPQTPHIIHNYVNVRTLA